MTHNELCRKTAEWVIRPPSADWLALYEYQSYATQEFPDVLSYSASGTRLYEIKMSHSDFLADAKKESRISWIPPVYAWANLHKQIEDIKTWQKKRSKALYVDKNFSHVLTGLDIRYGNIGGWRKSYIQVPHLGGQRFFVCATGTISENELPEGWGLIYFDGKKFKEIRKSGPWKADVRAERDLMAHALRRFASGDQTGILVHTY